MKKTFIAALSLVMCMGIAGTLLATTQVKAEQPQMEAYEAEDAQMSAYDFEGDEIKPIAAVWSVAKNTKITKARKKIFNKAMKGLVGVDYKPVAYLGSQPVSGMNHCFLCKSQVVYPGTKPYYTLVYIYEDLTGKVTISKIAEFNIGAMSIVPDTEE